MPEVSASIKLILRPAMDFLAVNKASQRIDCSVYDIPYVYEILRWKIYVGILREYANQFGVLLHIAYITYKTTNFNNYWIQRIEEILPARESAMLIRN